MLLYWDLKPIVGEVAFLPLPLLPLLSESVSLHRLGVETSVSKCLSDATYA